MHVLSATSLLVGAVLAQLPAPVTDYKNISLSDGRGIRYKEPQLCETTEGVKSYSGYIDIAPNKHIFFWFFESRSDPATDPITLWLNGGPGADSMTGLFDEIGPCTINEDFATTKLNPNSWNEMTNLLFLSQPIGVGFSYETKLETEVPLNVEMTETAEVRLAMADFASINSTEVAAKDGWDVMTTFYEALPELSPSISSKIFHMGTQSYGGHWGPGFFNTFRKQLDAFEDQEDTPFTLGTLMIVNGITDHRLQYPSFPKFAMQNTHGIHPQGLVSVYMEESLILPESGCLALVDKCELALASPNYYGDQNKPSLHAGYVCETANQVCRNTVEFPFITYTKSHNYDVRNSSVEKGDYPLPPGRYPTWLNLPEVQAAIGVDITYASSSQLEILASFGFTGDFANPTIINHLIELLDAGIRVQLWYGDADWACNWMGGESLSLGVNYTNSEHFQSAGYEKFTVGGKYLGDTREYGNFAFTRVFDAGHAMPFYQPEAAYALFNRAIHGKDTASGLNDIADTYSTKGSAESTYNQMHEKMKRSVGNSAKFRM